MTRLETTRAKAKMSAQTLGLWLGLLGVVIFSLTLPMTRLATGSAGDPQLSGLFIAMGRAAVAGLLSALLLVVQRPGLPARSDWHLIGLTALGAVFGFPLFTSIAMRHVESVHASVMLGVLPLTTAAIGAWAHKQRPSLGFWVCASIGSALVIGFAVLRSGHTGLSLHWADGVLLAGMGWAALSYVSGAKLSGRMPAEQVICWALVISLPISLPISLWALPDTTIRATSWMGFAYVSLFSMWIGFFAWYRGMALGGTVRVSQTQQLQPFLSMLISVPLLGEQLDLMTLCFGLAVMAAVIAGKRMPIYERHDPISGHLKN
jgi:drug/metabolite transporter (DMT)-like permease